jgi:hypothetical protein
MLSPFYEHELEILDDCAERVGASADLVRALLVEAATSGRDGRLGLRRIIERHIDSAVHVADEAPPQPTRRG